MKKRTLITAVLFAAFMMTGSAWAIYTAESGSWNNTSTWSTGVVPDNDIGWVRYEHTVTVDSSTSPKPRQVLLGRIYEQGHLIINSGQSFTNGGHQTVVGTGVYSGQQDLGTRSTMTVYGSYTHTSPYVFNVGATSATGGGGEGHGTLTIDGGAVLMTQPAFFNVGGTLDDDDGHFEANGIVNIKNGGTLNIIKTLISTNSVINLIDGLLSIDRKNPSDLKIDGGSINFSKGVLQQHLNKNTADFAGYWEDGDFTFSGLANAMSFTNTLDIITYTKDLGDGNTAYVGLDFNGDTRSFVVR